MLTTKDIIVWHDHGYQYTESFYPVQLLAFSHRGEPGSRMCNLKAVSFIPLLVRLAIELCVVGKQFGGGLLFSEFGRNNVLQNLISSDWTELQNREHRETVDSKCSQVLIQLRKMGLVKKEYIQTYLGSILCKYDNYFADKRFRFLIELDPSSLVQDDGLYWLPLYLSASRSSMLGFRSVFEAGIKYFPNKKGISLLFQTSKRYNCTPFHFACRRFGYEEVMKIVEDTLIRYSDTPINTTEALIMAVMNKNIHLDCVYFLLRRQPDILQKLLSSASITTMAAFNSNNNGISPKKRKRKEQAEGL